MQRQYLPVDYHAFAVLKTDGMFWAVDKMKDGIFVSRSKILNLFYFNCRINLVQNIGHIGR